MQLCFGTRLSESPLGLLLLASNSSFSTQSFWGRQQQKQKQQQQQQQQQKQRCFCVGGSDISEIVDVHFADDVDVKYGGDNVFGDGGDRGGAGGGRGGEVVSALAPVEAAAMTVVPAPAPVEALTVEAVVESSTVSVDLLKRRMELRERRRRRYCP
jgi:hypothetical protein